MSLLSCQETTLALKVRRASPSPSGLRAESSCEKCSVEGSFFAYFFWSERKAAIAPSCDWPSRVRCTVASPGTSPSRGW